MKVISLYNVEGHCFELPTVVLLHIVSGLAQSVQCLTADRTAGVRSPTKVEDFRPTLVFRPALGPTQPPVQGVPWALSAGVKRGRGVMLTTHPLLVPRLRTSRSYTSCHPDAPIWGVTGPLYFTVYLQKLRAVKRVGQVGHWPPA
jgi:hypothetical protein